MSYLVLARKWRPRSFDTLIGQDHVVRALTNALTSGRLHHAWLFTGTRGVGKTTLSRILAKSLNCADGVTATPCGHCQACTEIDAGRFVDYIELDAASNRGVDEMTQLLEQAVYAPSSGRYKVYMIDEVHMLTGHAFNAMLKTLEEPPEHVKFILATTDPQKIPVTVLSRCLQFNLKQMTVPAITGHLQHILEQESIPADAAGLRLIAQAASGSMRDALSLTDQAISYSAGNLTAAAVSDMLGTLDQDHLVALLRALAGADAAAVVAVADDLSARGLSFQAALADLAVLLSRVAIAQRLGRAPADDPLAEDITALAAILSPDDLQLFYAVAVHSRQELSLAPDEYAGFVMACLRMLALLPPDRLPAVPLAPPAAAPSSAPMVAESQPAAGRRTQPAAPQTQQAVAGPVSGPAPDTASSPAVQDATIVPVSQARPVPTSGDPLPIVGPEAGRLADLPPEPPAWEDPPAAAGQPPAVPSPSPAAPTKTEAPVEHTETPETLVRPSHPDAAPSSVVDAASAAGTAASSIAPAFGAALDEDDAQAAGDWTAQMADMPDDFDAVAAAEEHLLLETDLSEGLAGLSAASVVSGKQLPAIPVAPDPGSLTSADWPALAAALPVTGAARALALNSEWLSGDDHQIQLRVAIHTLTEGGAFDRLRTGLSEHFGRVLRLDVQYGTTGSETAYAVDRAAQEKRQQTAERAADQDSLVQALVEQFSARLVPGSVRPSAV